MPILRGGTALCLGLHPDVSVRTVADDAAQRVNARQARMCMHAEVVRVRVRMVVAVVMMGGRATGDDVLLILGRHDRNRHLDLLLRWLLLLLLLLVLTPEQPEAVERLTKRGARLSWGRCPAVGGPPRG